MAEWPKCGSCGKTMRIRYNNRGYFYDCPDSWGSKCATSYILIGDRDLTEEEQRYISLLRERSSSYHEFSENLPRRIKEEQQRFAIASRLIKALEAYPNLKKECIHSIEEIEEGNFHFSGEMGYVITTNLQVIQIFISSEHQCCEDTGYGFIDYPDGDLEYYSGAELLGVEIVTEDREVIKVVEFDDYDANSMFINVNTSLGTIQFTLYNDHNGYYSHRVTIKSNQLDYKGIL